MWACLGRFAGPILFAALVFEKIADKVRSYRSFYCCRSASHARLQENNQRRDDIERYNQRRYQAERQG